MALGVGQLAVEHGPDLIDPVGELEAAVLDVHDRLAVRHEAAVDIGDARPSGLLVLVAARAAPTPSDFSLRCRAERSMPMKAAVREMLPPKRMIWAFRYSRSNTSRASRSGRAMIRSDRPSPPRRRWRDLGRQHLGGDRLGRIAGRPGSASARRCCAAGGRCRARRGPAAWRWRPRRAARRGRPWRRADALDEIVDQLGDVLAPLRQARHAHRHHVQAVEQVLAEAARGDLLAQVARGRGDHPHVDLHVVCRRRRGGSAARPAPAGCGPGVSRGMSATSSR